MDALASGAIFRLTNTAVLRSPMPRHVMLSSSSGSSGSGSSSNSALPLTPSSLNGSPTKAVFSHSDFISPSAALHASSMPAPVANLVKPQPRRVPLGGANEGFLSSPAGDDVKKRFEQLSRESPMPRTIQSHIADVRSVAATASPVAVPTPVAAPVIAPVPTPVAAPVIAPVPSPVVAPVVAPAPTPVASTPQQIQPAEEPEVFKAPLPVTKPAVVATRVAPPVASSEDDLPKNCTTIQRWRIRLVAVPPKMTHEVLANCKKWIIVEGHRMRDGIPDATAWHSSIIVKRVSASLLQTQSGSYYKLHGPMLISEAEHADELPKPARAQFVDGFPENWIDIIRETLPSKRSESPKKRAAVATPQPAPVPTPEAAVATKRPEPPKKRPNPPAGEAASPLARPAASKEPTPPPTSKERTPTGAPTQPAAKKRAAPLRTPPPQAAAADPPSSAKLPREVSFLLKDLEVYESPTQEKPSAELLRSSRGRQVVKPVKYWENEKVKYDPSGRISAVVEIVSNETRPQHSRLIESPKLLPSIAKKKTAQPTAAKAKIDPQRKLKSTSTSASARSNPPPPPPPPAMKTAPKKLRKLESSSDDEDEDELGGGHAEEDDDDDDDEWTNDQMDALQNAVWDVAPSSGFFYDEVARLVPGKSAAQCQRKLQEKTFSSEHASVKEKPAAKKGSAASKLAQVNDDEEFKLAGKGTLKRRQQLRELAERDRADHEDDLFSATGRATPHSKTSKLAVSAASPIVDANSSPEILRKVPSQIKEVYLHRLQKEQGIGRKWNAIKNQTGTGSSSNSSSEGKARLSQKSKSLHNQTVKAVADAAALKSKHSRKRARIEEDDLEEDNDSDSFFAFEPSDSDEDEEENEDDFV